MAAISTWSKTAASNNAAPPDGWPEGQNPSSINDCARELMAALRTRFEDAEWFNHGHTLVQQSANSFLVSSTCTQIYTAGRRIKLFDSTTIYGDVIASSPSGSNTLITVSCSALTASLSSGEVSILDPANSSIPASLGYAKGWVKANFNGTSDASFNVTSVTDTGTGVITVNWATDFSSGDYAVVATPVQDQSNTLNTAFSAQVRSTNLAAGTSSVATVRFADGFAIDVNDLMVVAFGDQ